MCRGLVGYGGIVFLSSHRAGLRWLSLQPSITTANTADSSRRLLDSGTSRRTGACSRWANSADTDFNERAPLERVPLEPCSADAVKPHLRGCTACRGHDGCPQTIEKALFDLSRPPRG